MKRMKVFIVHEDMSNKNENNFCIASCPERGKGLLKFDIMICKAAIVTYIWGFSENLKN